ncbi:MAG: glycosyltransferase family 4 protein [Nanoarchaeota archaeon]
MKILLVIHRFPPFIGGFELHAFQLAKKLNELGHDLTVLTTDSLVDAPREEIMDGIKVIRAKTLFHIPKTRIPISPGIYNIKKGYDIVNVFGAIPLISDLVLIIAKLKGSKSVLNNVFDPIGDNLNLKSSLYKAVYKSYIFFGRVIISLFCDKIITWTKDYADNSDLLKGFKKTDVIGSGVDTNIFKPRIPKKDLVDKYGLENKKVILFVGRLDNYKGVKYLIDAIKNIENIKLLLVGDGLERKNLEKQVKNLKVADKVIFVGKKDQDELPYYYNLADIFILPSVTRQEAFGKVTIEAMASGVPAIVSELLGVKEVIDNGKAGLLIEVGNSNDIEKKLKLLLEDEKLRKGLIKKGLERVKENYTWDIIAERTIESFKKI